MRPSNQSRKQKSSNGREFHYVDYIELLLKASWICESPKRVFASIGGRSTLVNGFAELQFRAAPVQILPTIENGCIERIG